MPVSPNAAPDEFSSPFFIANEKVCQTFDAFIVANNGETRGKYNASSYHVLGKVRHPNKWEFTIKKATFTSGNLLLSAKYQNLHVASIWTAKNIQSDCPSFYIRRKKTLDFVKVNLFKNTDWLSNKKKYILNCQEPKHPFINDIMKKLKELIETDKIWEIHFKNSILKIELRSENTHTNILEELLRKSYKSA